jgi:hypothetical protein
MKRPSTSLFLSGCLGTVVGCLTGAAISLVVLVLGYWIFTRSSSLIQALVLLFSDGIAIFIGIVLGAVASATVAWLVRHRLSSDASVSAVFGGLSGGVVSLVISFLAMGLLALMMSQ